LLDRGVGHIDWSFASWRSIRPASVSSPGRALSLRWVVDDIARVSGSLQTGDRRFDTYRLPRNLRNLLWNPLSGGCQSRTCAGGKRRESTGAPSRLTQYEILVVLDDFASVSLSSGTNASNGYEEPDACTPTKVFCQSHGCRPVAR